MCTLFRCLTVLSMWVFAASPKLLAQSPIHLSPDAFERAIHGDSVQLLDVRTPEEYSTGHLVNALLIDWSQQPAFAEKAASLDKGKPVYLYCLSGGRGTAAASWLSERGFAKVYHLEGGISAWQKQSKPVTPPEPAR